MTEVITRPTSTKAASTAAKDRTHCLDFLLDAGFADFEFRIPGMEQANYFVSAFRCKPGWCVEVYDDMMGHGKETLEARAAGATLAEALWSVTATDKHPEPWAGEASALPARLKAMGARLWCDAVTAACERENAEADRAAEMAACAAQTLARAIAARDTAEASSSPGSLASDPEWQQWQEA